MYWDSQVQTGDPADLNKWDAEGWRLDLSCHGFTDVLDELMRDDEHQVISILSCIHNIGYCDLKEREVTLRMDKKADNSQTTIGNVYS